MKRIVLLMCLACANLIGSICAESHVSELMDIKATKLYIRQYGIRRMSASTPVEIYQNPTNLNVCFLQSLGSVNICVVNKYNYPVYQQTVNATEGSNYTINTQGWSNGGYTITLRGDNFERYAEFVIE